MEFILPIVIVLAVVTFVGHGIWVVLAWLFRLGEPTRPKGAVGAGHSVKPTGHCPRCDTALKSTTCHVCLWPLVGGYVDRSLAGLQELRRRLRQLSALKLIPPSTFDRLNAVLGAEIDRASVPGQTASSAQERPTDPVSAPQTAPSQTAVARSDDEKSPRVEGDEVQTPAAVPATPKVVAPPSQSADKPVTERVREYAARRRGASVEPVATSAPQPPRRRWTEVFAAFMEEKNIRWGELIGGLLIVGGSVALVMSFWARISERPFLKFVVFNGVTAGLFALGLYSERRWKLRTTSEGLLITASLLVPLNFLAIAAFASTTPSTGVLAVTVVGELISMLLFGFLLWRAGQLLVPRDGWYLAAGTLFPCAVMLLVRRFVTTDPTSILPELSSWAILGSYLAVNCLSSQGGLRLRGGVALVEPPTEAASPRSALQRFTLLGISSFAALLGLALVVHHLGAGTPGIRRLSPILGAMGATPLFVGLSAWRRAQGSLHVTLRLTAMSTAVAGAMFLLAGVMLAWPDPQRLLLTSLVSVAVLTVVAVWEDLPQAYLGVVPGAIVSYLVAWHALRGHLGWRSDDADMTMKAILSGESGQVLFPLSVGFVALAALMRRLGRVADQPYLVGSGLAVAVISALLLACFGLGVLNDPYEVVPFFLLYAGVAYVVADHTRRPAVLWGSMLLLLGSVVQGVVYRWGPQFGVRLPWATALLGHALATGAWGLAVLLQSDKGRRERFVGPLSVATIATSLAGLIGLAFGLGGDATASVLLTRFVGLSMVWFCVAWMHRSSGWMSACQAALAMAVVMGGTMRLQAHPWFHSAAWPWLDPRALTEWGIGLAIFGIVWQVIRLLARLQPGRLWRMVEELLRSTWLATDTLVLHISLAACSAVAIYAVVPGAMRELSPRSLFRGSEVAMRVVPPIQTFQMPGISHEHASDWRVWLWIALLAVATAMVFLRVPRVVQIITSLVLAWLISLLVASRWTDEVATASALRWLSSGFLLGTSALIWCRDGLQRQLRRFPWLRSWDHVDRVTNTWHVTSVVFLLSLAPVCAMAIYVVSAALASHPTDQLLARLANVTFLLMAVGVFVGLILRVVAWSLSRTARDARWIGGRPLGRLSTLAFILASAPYCAVALFMISLALKKSPILGPDPSSWFARVGLATSYAVPVLATALTLTGYAIRERSSRFAFAGGLVLNVGVTAAYALAHAKTGFRLDVPTWIQIAQWNALSSAAFALGWIAAHYVRRRRVAAPIFAVSDLLITQISLPMALEVLISLPTWLLLFADPAIANLSSMGSGLAWVAAGTMTAAVLAVRPGLGQPIRPMAWGIVGLVVCVLVAATAVRFSGTPWTGFRVLLWEHLAILMATIAVPWWYDYRLKSPSLSRWRYASRLGILVSVPLVLLSTRALFEKPLAMWGSVHDLGLAALAVAALLMVGFAWRALRGGLLYYAALLMVVATIGWRLHAGAIWGGVFIFPVRLDLLQWAIGALCLPVCGWVLIERFIFAPAGDLVTRVRMGPVQQWAVRLSLLAFGYLLVMGLSEDLSWSGGTTGAIPIVGQWMAIGSLAIASMALCWDGSLPRGAAIRSLYVVGLGLAGCLLDSLDLNGHLMFWLGSITLATFSLATSYLWSCRHGLYAWGKWAGMPYGDEESDAHLDWLVKANGVIAVVIVAMSFFIVWTYSEATLRVLAAKSVLAMAGAVGLLAKGERRTGRQYASLLLGVCAAAVYAWAPIGPAGALLDRAVALAAALGVMVVIYGVGLSKWLPSESEWLTAARRLIPGLIVGAAGTLGFVLATEGLMYYRESRVVMSDPAIVLVTITLVGLCLAGLAAAVLPGRDPLQLSPRGRQAYVYGAEILLALVFVHLRLTVPWLFAGVFDRYWPIVVMALAFAGAGIGEWMRRHQQTVLADPLETTGAILPLLPAIGYWMVPLQMDYSLLLVAAGLLYAGLAVARKSFGFGVLAALFAHGGLWHFLHRLGGLGLLEHPQLWLIPPAACVLIAAHLNRKELAAGQLAAIRYAAAAVVYGSSTADVFLNGVAQAPWLPLVLAGLSLLGIFFGIMLRIRAFVILGVVFLLLALMTVIWHAAVDLEQTWIWYACCVGVGILIVMVFAVFEKKRDQVLRLAEGFKHWE